MVRAVKREVTVRWERSQRASRASTPAQQSKWHLRYLKSQPQEMIVIDDISLHVEEWRIVDAPRSCCLVCSRPLQLCDTQVHLRVHLLELLEMMRDM